MSSDNIAIYVTNLSKCYQVYATPRDRLKQFIIPSLYQGYRSLKNILSKLLVGNRINLQALRTQNLGPIFYKEFWALKEVTFQVKKGETIGIIGRNGSGKSTLLQMICGTLTPTTGEITINGRVAALLELGSGFNPEFTGRENVYLNASVLGLNIEQIKARLQDILIFADIGEFIDQPVKNYSSGMYVRLAYAVIAHVGADILVIDEALAVGDVFFQQKCMRHLREFQSSGGTVIFVSHDTAAVNNLCDSALFLLRGSVAAYGGTDDICQKYVKDIYAERVPLVHAANNLERDSAIAVSETSLINKLEETLISGAEQASNLIQISPFRPEADSFGQDGARITDAFFEGQFANKLTQVLGGDRINFYLVVDAKKDIESPAFGFMVKDRLGQIVIAEGTDMAFREHRLRLRKGAEVRIKFSFNMPILIHGDYAISLAVAEGIGDDHIQHHWINDALLLHSIGSRLVHGITGAQDLKIEANITSKH